MLTESSEANRAMQAKFSSSHGKGIEKKLWSFAIVMRQNQPVELRMMHQHRDSVPIDGCQKSGNIRLFNPACFIPAHGGKTQRFEARISHVCLGGKLRQG